MPGQGTYREIAERNQNVIKSVTAAMQPFSGKGTSGKLGADANKKFKAEDRPANEAPSPEAVSKMLEATALLIAIATERNLSIGIALPSGGVLPLTEKGFKDGMKKWNNGGENLLPALEIAQKLMNKVKRNTAAEKITEIILADPNIKKIKPAAKKAAPKA